MSGQRPERPSEPSLDLTELQPRNYSRYFLAENPFPTIPVAEESPSIFVDRESVISLIRDAIVSSVSTEKSQTVVLQGVYGSGKSHILKYVRTSINTQLSNRPQGKALAVYLESPGISFKEFYSGIVAGLGIPVLKEIAAKIISDYVLSERGRANSYFVKTVSGQSAEAFAQKLRGNPSYLGDTLQHLRFFDLFYDITKTYEQQVKVRDYLNSLLQLLVPVNEFTSWRWLLGEPLGRDERDRLKVSQEIEDKNSLDAIQDLLLVFKTGGYRTLFILLDELEDVVELHATRRSKYFSDLRHFVDRNTNGICLIACVTATGFSEIRASGHPLERRLLAVNEVLGKFDAAKSLLLVKAYLRASRTKFLKKGGESENSLKTKVEALGGDLFPFTEAVVNKVCERAEGNVGDILSICHKVIDGACDKNLDIIPDVSFVDTILEA